MRHQPALDGLRGVAVVAVLALPRRRLGRRGGYLGVDVFLVLSGFLITTLLLAERAPTGRIDLRRVLGAAGPAAAAGAARRRWSVVAVYAAGSPPGEPDRIRRDGLSTLALRRRTGAWSFGGESYFEQFAAPSPLRHTWSLAIEEQWYLVWPLVVALVRRGGAVPGAVRSPSCRDARRGLGRPLAVLASGAATHRGPTTAPTRGHRPCCSVRSLAIVLPLAVDAGAGGAVGGRPGAGGSVVVAAWWSASTTASAGCTAAGSRWPLVLAPRRGRRGPAGGCGAACCRSGRCARSASCPTGCTSGTGRCTSCSPRRGPGCRGRRCWRSASPSHAAVRPRRTTSSSGRSARGAAATSAPGRRRARHGRRCRGRRGSGDRRGTGGPDPQAPEPPAPAPPTRARRGPSSSATRWR